MSSKSSTDPGEDGGTVLVGRVLRPHGLGGEVVVEVATDNPERFAPGAELLWMPGGAAGEAPVAGARRRLVVDSVRPHRGALLIRFDGCRDRDGADELRGAELAVPAGAVPEPPEGTYYHFQLLGCRVRDEEAGELGAVVELLEDGGGLLLVVEGGGRRLPVPFVASFLRRVDVAGKEIEVALPPGLIEACTSTS